MFKHVLAGAAALTFIAGTGFAQDQNTTERQQTVIQNPDGSQTINKSKTEQTIGDDGSRHVESHNVTGNTDPLGNQTVTKKSSESSRDPDGSTHQETTTETHKDD